MCTDGFNPAINQDISLLLACFSLLKMQLKGQTLTHDPVINHPIIDQLTIQKESKKNYLLAQK